MLQRRLESISPEASAVTGINRNVHCVVKTRSGERCRNGSSALHRSQSERPFEIAAAHLTAVLRPRLNRACINICAMVSALSQSGMQERA